MKRLMTALASIALIGTLFVGAPKPVFAVGGADTFYVGFGGGSDAGCGVPDYDLDHGPEGYWDGDSWEYTSNAKIEDALYEFFDNDGTLDVTDGDTIVICDGWFHLHADGPEWNGDLTPGVDVNPSTITIRGLGKNDTFLSGLEPGDEDPFDQSWNRPFYFANTNLILEDMTIINTSSINDNLNLDGGAIYLNYGSLTINDVDFVNFVSEDGNGGAIAVTDADLDLNNVSFDQTTGVSFDPSTGTWPYDANFNEGSGGAIWASVGEGGMENLVVDIDNSDFNNIGTQDVGGAIYVVCAATTITNTDFYDNTAGISGGAIFTYGGEECDTVGSLTIDQSVFEGNYVHDDFGGDGTGGAVVSVHQPVTVTDSSFGTVGSGNSAGNDGTGGALWIDGTSGTEVLIEDSDFEDNYAEDYGGAIYTHCVNLEVTGDATGTTDDIGGVVSSTFYSNYADDNDGGAIFVGAENCNDDMGGVDADDLVSATIDGVYFEANDAEGQGGVVATDQSGFNYLSELVVRSSTFYENGSDYTNNQGGVLNSDYVDVSIYSSSFVGNRTSGTGGVLELCGGDLHAEDSYFNQNYSGNDGGALFVDDGCGRNDAGNVTIIDSEFDENGSLDDGGALSVPGGHSVVSIVGSSFTDNTTGNDGGAAHIYDATTNITNSLFEGNLSGDEGGAINFDDSNSLTINASEFIDNSTGYNWYGSDWDNWDGGAIDFGTGYDDVYLGIFDSLFEGNYASDEGGAIWAEATNTLGLFEISRSEFLNNTANDEGGAIWIDLDDEGTLTVDRTVFEGNTSYEDGGAINQETEDYGTFVRITNSRFTENFADSDGGALDLTDRTVLTNNTFNGNTTDDGDGGAVELNYSNPNYDLAYLHSVSNNVFRNNFADEDAGALEVNGAAQIVGNTFQNNGSEEDGGAVYLQSNLDYTNWHLVSGNRFYDNSSLYEDGGAIMAVDDAVISSNEFARNYSEEDGGALFLDYEGRVSRNTFLSNVSDEDGGAIYANDLSFPDSSITDNLFDGNAAQELGGALWIDNDEGVLDHKLVIASNRIIRNTAQNGAGMYVTYPNGEGVVATQIMTGIVRNTFERNIASQNGGAIMMEYLGGSYRTARAALQSLQKAVKNNRYKANKANLDRATGDIGGWAVSIEFGAEADEVGVDAPETPNVK